MAIVVNIKVYMTKSRDIKGFKHEIVLDERGGEYVNLTLKHNVFSSLQTY